MYQGRARHLGQRPSTASSTRAATATRCLTA